MIVEIFECRNFSSINSKQKLYIIEKCMKIITVQTSMMWPSKNFLLYNRNIIKMKVTEWINNLKKYVNPPSFGDIYNMCK